MTNQQQTEADLDRFEGEGGALASRSQRQRGDTLGTAPRQLLPSGTPSNWHVRPAFLAELDAVLQAQDNLESERTKNRTIALDVDEEFVQDFQEKLDEQVLPHLRSAADLLSKRSYPVELRVVGKPQVRTCFLAVSRMKAPGNWAIQGESITGPRMTFSADLPSHAAVYATNFHDGVPHTENVIMQLSKITDSFIERELRQLFVSLVGEERKNASAATPSLDGSTLMRAVRNTCA
jgi:hypothetical protein